MKMMKESIEKPKRIARRAIDILMWCLSALTHTTSLFFIVGIIIDFGFTQTPEQESELEWIYYVMWSMFIISHIANCIFTKGYLHRMFHSSGLVLNLLLLLTMIPLFVPLSNGLKTFAPWLFALAESVTLRNGLVLILAVKDLSGELMHMLGKKTNPSIVMAGSFLLIILLGSVLLLLPNCTQDTVNLKWIDSFFIATSAVCVTGLTPVDVAEVFTRQGHIILALLIQIGGLGVMTITSFFAMFFMGNITMKNQLVMQDLVSSKTISSLFSTLMHVLGFTIAIEAVGAAMIWHTIHGMYDMNLDDEVFTAIFHSISAFCNAGFSTLPDGMSSQVMLHDGMPIYWILGILVILGGIGYPILTNLAEALWRKVQAIVQWMFRRRRSPYTVHLYSLNTKIMLFATTLLIVGGTCIILFFEWDGAFSGMSPMEKLTQAFFNAVSPRTAGFISVPLTSMCTQTILIYMLLMWIGGGSQSTAGGIKVNAFTVAIINLRMVLKGQSRAEIFGRELSLDTIRRSNATVMASMAILATGIFVISMQEPDIPLRNLAFECFSALGTVGSSLDTTQLLSTHGKVTIILLMFLGRVGVLTILVGVVRQHTNGHYRLPKDDIIIS